MDPRLGADWSTFVVVLLILVAFGVAVVAITRLLEIGADILREIFLRR